MLKKRKDTERKVKAISYNIQPEVNDALSVIMQRRGINTITKAINYCIVTHLPLAEKLSDTENKLTEALQANYSVSDVIGTFIRTLRLMDKHTKTS